MLVDFLGNTLNYYYSPGNFPTVIFLGGFRSNNQGNKAQFLKKYCIDHNQAFLSFDYYGHGLSSGKFEEGSIGIWLENVIFLIKHFCKSSIILIGSSMGAWLMLKAALKLSNPIQGLIGIASAPDFTEHLIWNKLSLSEQECLLNQGFIKTFDDYGESYLISKHLIMEARKHFILDKKLDIHCPVRLLHGLADKDVPWKYSEQLVEKIQSQDIQLILVKGACHRLQRESDLSLLALQLTSLLTGSYV
ncbi:MAG: acyl-CoA esterase [Francisellaceae bacterium]|nr:acyl-CoA esterase [Francisellaceae bacterium]